MNGLRTTKPWLAVMILAASSHANGQAIPVPATPALASNGWIKLDTVPFKGKQDDLYFASGKTGWYGNGQGKLYKTVDGGQHWDEQWNEPGTFIRALGFVSEQVGVLGNVGTDYFPGVTDETPLYRTSDGGDTWEPARISGPMPKGICAIDVYRKPFVDHGILGYKTTLRAGGRVGGPAFLLRSDDEGQSWQSRDLSSKTAMILDVKFLSDTVGFIAGATSANVEESHALVLRTGDGGETWEKVYESSRPFEITWKLAFPSTSTGFVTVQNYNPEASVSARVVAKTSDGGKHWTELPLANDHEVQEFGIAFVDDRHGWVGSMKQGFETNDGGATWKPMDFGKAVNKIRIVTDQGKRTLYAIGSSVYRLDLK